MKKQVSECDAGKNGGETLDLNKRYMNHQDNIQVRLSRLIAALDRWLRNNAVQQCLADDENCDQQVVKAHSVQSAYVMEQLIDRGHVYMFKADSKHHIILKRTGRKQATTFTGFCADHDNHLFREIDFDHNRTFDPKSKRQRLLLSMRAAAREYWAKLNSEKLYTKLDDLVRRRDAAELMRILDIGEKDVNFLTGMQNNIPKLSLMGTKVSRARIRRIFRSLMTQLKNEKYHLTITVDFHFPGVSNCAVASGFAPEFDLTGRQLNTLELHTGVSDVVLNVLPIGGQTWFLFTFHRKHSQQLSPLFRQFYELNQNHLAIALGQMVIMHCENVVLAPHFVERLDDNERLELTSLFGQTMQAAIPYNMAPQVQLFLKPDTKEPPSL